jgi:PEP-CTERM motif
MKLSALILAFAAAAAASLPAMASEMSYQLDYSGSGINADLIVTTSDVLNSDGSYTIDALSGERNGMAVTGLLPAGDNPPTCSPGPCWFLVSDNEFFPTAPFLDSGGFSYTLGGGYGVPGGDDVNLYFDSATSVYYDLTQSANAANCDGMSSCSYLGTPVTLSVTPVPEPGTMGLFGACLAGLGWVLRRRTRAFA